MTKKGLKENGSGKIMVVRCREGIEVSKIHISLRFSNKMPLNKAPLYSLKIGSLIPSAANNGKNRRQHVTCLNSLVERKSFPWIFHYPTEKFKGRQFPIPFKTKTSLQQDFIKKLPNPHYCNQLKKCTPFFLSHIPKAERRRDIRFHSWNVFVARRSFL